MRKYMTTDELIQRYKKLYKRKTGKELTDDEALDQAVKLVTLVEAIYRPITKGNMLK